MLRALHSAPWAFAIIIFARGAFAQDAGGIAMPPPPPESDPISSQGEAPAAARPAQARATSVTAPPPPPNASTEPVAGEPVAIRVVRPRTSAARVRRTLARLDAILTDEAESDWQQRRAVGTALLIGGAVSAATAVVPFVLPAGSVSTALTVTVEGSWIGFGGRCALMGGVAFLARGNWEQMAQELHDDPVTDPEARLSAAIGRWEQRIAREQSGQRAFGGTLIALGAVAFGAGVWAMASNGGRSGYGMALGVPLVMLGGVYVPLGVVALGFRTATERALRVFRLSQGGRLAAWSSDAPRVLGVAPSLNGAAIYGTF